MPKSCSSLRSYIAETTSSGADTPPYPNAGSQIHVELYAINFKSHQDDYFLPWHIKNKLQLAKRGKQNKQLTIALKLAHILSTSVLRATHMSRGSCSGPGSRSGRDIETETETDSENPNTDYDCDWLWDWNYHINQREHQQTGGEKQWESLAGTGRHGMARHGTGTERQGQLTKEQH